MTNEEYITLKEDYVNHIKEFITEKGELFPHISVFCKIKDPKDEDEKKPAIIHIVIPNEFMKDEKSKDLFLDKYLPLIATDIKEKFLIHSIIWSCEAWLRIADKDFDIVKNDYKELPIKKEVIIISIESDGSDETIIYEIKRTGKQITNDGKLVDTVVLEEFITSDFPSKTGGRFTGLFKKFKN